MRISKKKVGPIAFGKEAAMTGILDFLIRFAYQNVLGIALAGIDPLENIGAAIHAFRCGMSAARQKIAEIMQQGSAVILVSRLQSL